MTEQAIETVEANETATEAHQPTLDDISQEFNVEEQISNFQAQPEQAGTQTQQSQYAPDPVYNPDAFNSFVQEQVGSVNALNQTVQELAGKVQSYEQQIAQQKVDADVGAAVAKVNEKIGADPDMVEIALEHQYRRDASFKKIWDNRSQNPKAFEKALEVVADKLAGKFNISQDHQLTQNQIAAKQSLKTMAKTTNPDPNSMGS